MHIAIHRTLPVVCVPGNRSTCSAQTPDLLSDGNIPVLENISGYSSGTEGRMEKQSR